MNEWYEEEEANDIVGKIKDVLLRLYLLYKLIGEVLAFSLKMPHQISYSHTLPSHPYF